MLKSCKQCNRKISLKEAFGIWNKNKYKGYTCKICKTKYKPTKLSMIINFFVMFAMYMSIFMVLAQRQGRFFEYLICYLIVGLIVPVFIIRYEIVE